MYLMTCTRPDLAYPLSILSRYVAPVRHRPEHMAAAKRVLRYLCSTSGMGLVLGGRRPVVLTGHADASWADDQTTQRSSQGYTFSLGSGSVSWRSTRSSSVLSSSCEAEIYAGAMAAQELRWLTYLLTDLGEQPRSPPVLYVDNKAMLALCREHRLEHRTKHIALRYFLARELQQRGQLRLAYVASEANTADIFTKALAPGDHQRFCTMLACFALFDWSCDLLFSPTLPMGAHPLEAILPTKLPFRISGDGRRDPRPDWHLNIGFLFNAAGTVMCPPLVMFRLEDELTQGIENPAGHPAFVHHTINETVTPDTSSGLGAKASCMLQILPIASSSLYPHALSVSVTRRPPLWKTLS
ncbi:unnamed protein product [Closterium sp. NIES-53]